MANPKSARLVSAQQLNPLARLLKFESQEELHFIGGQYLIFDSGIVLSDGKRVKRAYSIASSDAEQKKFEVIVKKIEEGPGSNFLHDLALGSEVAFSGPWGQFIAETGKEISSSLLIATDTGITAALGLLQGSLFKQQVKRTQLLWFVESENYFLTEQFIKEKIESRGINFKMMPLVSAEHLPAAQSALQRILKESSFDAVFLSGDGALLYPFKEMLLAKNLKEEQIKIECFFNNPFKKIITKA